MSYWIRGWFRCDCGKIHGAHGVTKASVCRCGRKLWDRSWNKNAEQDPPVITGRPE